MKILFDCRVILDGFAKNGYGRAGIYFAAFNILKYLRKREDCEVFMYCGHFDYESFSSKVEWAPKVFFIDKVELRLVQIYQELHRKLEESKRKDKLLLALITKIKKNCVKSAYLCIEWIPAKLRYPGVEVFISPINRIPNRFAKEQGIKKALWIYDLIPLINNMREHKWFFEMLHSLNKSDIYFTDSQSARNDLLLYKGHVVDKQRVFAIPLAASEDFHPLKDLRASTLEKYGLSAEKKYIFSLCTLTERKNLLRVVRTFIQFIDKHDLDDITLVLGGGVVGNNREKLLKEVGNRNEIKFIGYVADEDLAALYSGSEWFVYTSSYEGFGLPPLEAMACGCPVITSNNSSLPEVVGDAGQQINWDSDEEHVEAYERYYFDNDFRQKMAEKGVQRAKEFNWSNTVNDMVKKLKTTPLKKTSKAKGMTSVVLKISQKIAGFAVKKVTKFKFNRNAVLMMDNLAEPKNNLQDNFTFFKYLFYKKDADLVPYYIIHSESPYLESLQKEFGDCIVKFNPKRPSLASQIQLVKLSKKLKFVCDSFQSIKLLGMNFAKSVRRSQYITTIFTQHGVTFFKPNFVSIDVYGANVFDKVVCSNHYEKDLFLKRGRYHPLNIIANGLFRWDNIKTEKSERKSIFVFFTTRRYLSMMEAPGQSDYCKKIMSLVTNRHLNEMLKKNGVELRLALHHSMADYVRESLTKSNISIIGEDEIFDAKCTSSLLITDYSSMCFEFLYQKKPVIFYHFDDSIDCKKYGHVLDVQNALKGKENHLFNLFDSEKETIDALEKYINNGFVLEDNDLVKANKFYYYRDGFCERFYNYLKDSDKSKF